MQVPQHHYRRSGAGLRCRPRRRRLYHRLSRIAQLGDRGDAGGTAACRCEGDGCHLEWSANERVALEVAIGACLGGRRSLVCTKSVGMNVMVDPLMALNLTPLSAGMVIILGDDPGAYGSQNDQDTRALADLIELPMVEPDDAVCRAGLMVEAAFTASERYALPVVVRVTRSFDTCREASGSMLPPPNFDLAGAARVRWRARRSATCPTPATR